MSREEVTTLCKHEIKRKLLTQQVHEISKRHLRGHWEILSGGILSFFCPGFINIILIRLFHTCDVP